MFKNKRLIGLLILALIMVLALAACDGDDEDDGEEEEATPVVTVEPTEEATEEPTEEVATEEAVEEATEEATEEPTDEAAAEVTEEAAAEEPTEEAATEEATEEAAEVAMAPEEATEEVATEEAAEEPTEEPTEEAAEEVTEEPTEAAAEEPTEEAATEEAAADEATEEPATDAEAIEEIEAPALIDCEQYDLSDLQIGLITDVGRIADKSFNQNSWEGVLAASLCGADVDYIETVDSADYADNIAEFAESGYSVIVTVGFALGPATLEAAANYPDITFIGVDQFQAEPVENVVGLVFNEDQSGFLAGVLAARLNETGTIAAVLGTDQVPAVVAFNEGFQAGARHANPDINIISTYHPGGIDQAFTDPEWGATTARQALDQDADVIFAAGGLTGNGGLIEVANSVGEDGPPPYCIGVDTDQWETVPEAHACLVSSAMKLLDVGVADIIMAIQDGTVEPGNFFGAAALAPFHDLDATVPDDVKQELEEIAAALQDGSLTTGYGAMAPTEETEAATEEAAEEAADEATEEAAEEPTEEAAEEPTEEVTDEAAAEESEEGAAVAMAPAGEEETEEPAEEATEEAAEEPTEEAAEEVTDEPTEEAAEEATEEVEVTVTEDATDEATEEPATDAEAIEEIEAPALIDCEQYDLSDLQIGLITDVGRIADKSFNQNSWEGVLAASLCGADVDYIETVDSADYADNIAEFAESGYSVIVTVGFALGPATLEAAANYPDITFIGVDQFQAEPVENVVGLVFNEDQSGFLAGVLAARLNETGTIAAVLGTDQVPAVVAFNEGFQAGARHANPDINIISTYHPGGIDQAFTDPEWGATTARQALDQDADVIFAAGGLTGNGGLIEVANSVGEDGPPPYCIGVDTDQWETVPEAHACLVSSAMKLLDKGVADIITAIYDGTLEPGNFFGAAALAPFHDFEDVVPDDVKQELVEVAQGLGDGTITTGYGAGEPAEEPTEEATEEDTAIGMDSDMGVVTVGMNAEYPPFEFVDEDGNVAGFDVDLMNAIAEEAGFDIEFVNTRWDGIFVALQSGEFDAVSSAATITDEREEIVDFSEPYFNAGQTIAVLEDRAEEISSLDDLAGMRVGVQAGTTGDIWASENIPGVEMVRYDEITLAFQALANGDIDAVFNDGPTSADIISQNPEMGALIVGEPVTNEFYGIAVQPDQPELLDAINEGLAAIIANGTYQEIFEQWFGTEPPEMFQPAE